MPWIKLDEAFLDHPKFLAAGPLAGYLAIAGIAWSRRNGTDGQIPEAQVERLVNFRGFAHHMWMGEIAGGGDDAEAVVLAEELVDCGLWERLDDGWQIHDYLDWQDSSATVSAIKQDLRAKRQKAGKLGAEARKRNNGYGKPMANAEQTDGESREGRRRVENG